MGHFLHFYPPNIPENKKNQENSEKLKKASGDMMYASPDM